MKRKILTIGAAICSIIVVLLIVAILFKPAGPPSSVPLSVEHATSLYNNSLDAIRSAQYIVQTVNSIEEINFNGSLFSEKLMRTEIYNGIRTGNPIIRIDEQMEIGTHSVRNFEIYTDGKAYLTIAGSQFVADCPQEELTRRLTPSILFDAALYNEISGVDTGKEFIITFASPMSAEAWLSITDSSLITAGGTVSISYNGQLTSSTYNVAYNRGNSTVTKTVTVTVQLVHNEVTKPEETNAYTPISYIDGPRALERISGYLTQAECVSSEYTDSIYFGALGDKREQTIILHGYKDLLWSAAVQTGIVLSNDGYANQQTAHTKQETYVNNTYSVKTDDRAPVLNPDITEDSMREYLQNLLLSTVMLPKYIASAETVETESTFKIQYTGTEEFAAFLRENAGLLLYQDPTLLNDSNSTVHTTELICHITLDKQTGLPISSGINYIGSYSSEGLPYQFHYRAEQNYALANSETLANINKAAGN